MENASKALMMAGGILIALLVIGALLLMINRVGIYSRSQDDDKKYTQLSDFNRDFERYCDDKGINGTDIISLINKVNNYNSKANEGGVINSVDYSIKMSITIRGLGEFNKKFASNLFRENPPYNGDELRSVVVIDNPDENTKRMLSEFKMSKFKSYREPIYNNGQIQKMFFEYVKE